MNSTVQKGLKPFIIKIIAIAMSVCYVFGPSHNEVDKFLHILTHQLEMPNTVLAHSNYSSHIDHEDHDFEKSDELHEHSLLDVLNKILKASDSEDDSKHSKIVTQKIDKHIRTKQIYQKQRLLSNAKVQHHFLFTLQNIRKGFPKGKFQPPQMG